jgi:hypothetical protein
MGMRMPETCWAVFKRQVLDLESCCILLVVSVESMTMHGLANPKSHFIFFQLYSDNNFQYFSYTVLQLGSSNQNTATVRKSFSNASIRLPSCHTPTFWPFQHNLCCHNTTSQAAFPSATSVLIFSLPFNTLLWSLIYFANVNYFTAACTRPWTQK